MSAFVLIAGHAFGIYIYVQNDDLQTALLWFIWGIALAALNFLVDIRRAVVKKERA